MIELIKILIEAAVISFACIGLKVCYAPTKIFSFYGNFLKRVADKKERNFYIVAPLGHCHYCMASVYGIIFHCVLCLLGCAGSTALLPATLLIVIVLNGILYGVLDKLDKGLFE